jgi:hypothetical protein
LASAQLAMDITSKKMCLDGVQKVSTEPSCDHPNHPDGMLGLPRYEIGMVESGDDYRVYCDWANSETRLSHLALPEAILNLYIEHFFMDDLDVSTEDRLRCTIQGYTEYMRKGKRYRAHPNHNGLGQHYDWAVISDPNLEHTQATQAPRNPKSDEFLFNGQSSLDEWYGEAGNYLPARILAFYKHPHTGVDMAIVHPCCQRKNKNANRSSVVTESWHLASTWTNPVDKSTNKKIPRLVPMYNLIRGIDIVDRCQVFMEEPVIQEDWPSDKASGHVILLTSRSNRWANDYIDQRSDAEVEQAKINRESELLAQLELDERID